MEDVCELPNGFHLLRKSNEVGGYTYYTDELGAMIWDTCLVDEYTLMVAIAEEKRRTYLEYHINKRLVGANKVWDILIENGAELECDRSNFLLWFKTSLPFYPQKLMETDKKQLSRVYNIHGNLGPGATISFCEQMINAKVDCTSKYYNDERQNIIFKINKQLSHISC